MAYVISLCDYTGNMVKPWLEAGFDCVIVDIKHPAREAIKQPKGNTLHVLNNKVEDLRTALNADWLANCIGFAFPPCTDVAVSGARHFQSKGLGALIRSLTTLESCVYLLEQCKAWMLENPVSTFSTYWRKPDYTFSPHEYASATENFAEEMYTKRTCLWTGGAFIMPPKRDIFVKDPHKIHYLGARGQEERSVTPTGFARAVFEANKHLFING